MPDIEARLDRLEADMAIVKTTLARLETMIIRIDERMTTLATKAEIIRIDEWLNSVLPTLATKAELADMKISMTERFGKVDAELARRPTTGGVWIVAIVLWALVISSLALTPIYLPLVQRLLLPTHS